WNFPGGIGRVALTPAQERANHILLSIRDLAVEFAGDGGGVFRALGGVSFDIPSGSTVALVGESGSGKSVTAQAIMRILPKKGRIAAGSILFDEAGGAPVDIAQLPPGSEAM